MRLLQPASTHNSFLSRAEGYGLCRNLQFAVQKLTMAQQINQGIRQLQIDVFLLDGQLFVCHPCLSDCAVAMAVCGGTPSQYAASGVAVGSPYFGCNPEENLSFRAALGQIWGAVNHVVSDNGQSRGEECLVVHIEMHLDKTQKEVERMHGDTLWLRQFAESVQAVIPSSALVATAVGHGSRINDSTTTAALSSAVPETQRPPMWILLAAAIIYDGVPERAHPTDLVFTSPRSPIYRVVVPDENPVLYPSNLLSRLQLDGSCSLIQPGSQPTIPPRHFTYLVGSILSSSQAIREAYRCGYACRADMASNDAIQSSLDAMIWSWSPESKVISLNASDNVHRVYLNASDGRWYASGSDASTITVSLCVAGRDALVGARDQWSVRPLGMDDPNCALDVPRTGWENHRARLVLQQKGIFRAWIQSAIS